MHFQGNTVRIGTEAPFSIQVSLRIIYVHLKNDLNLSVLIKCHIQLDEHSPTKCDKHINANLKCLKKILLVHRRFNSNREEDDIK